MMLGFLKRNTKLQTNPAENTAAYEPVQDTDSVMRHSKKQDVQLLLHANLLFPNTINIEEHNWVSVTFYPSNSQFKQAAAKLRGMQQEGLITVQEPLQWHGYNGWTARLKLSA
jgi:hypothetical protein